MIGNLIIGVVGVFGIIAVSLVIAGVATGELFK